MTAVRAVNFRRCGHLSVGRVLREVSPALATQVKRAHYSHVERKAGLSDHSILIVELDNHSYEAQRAGQKA